MKKIVLLLVLALGLPACLSAQIQDKSYWEKMWSGQLVDEFKESGYYQNPVNASPEYNRQFSHIGAAIDDLFQPPAHIQDVPMPERGLYKFIFNRTEEALTKLSKNGYYRKRVKAGPIGSFIQDIFFPEGYVELPDTPKSKMREYAYNHAVRERQKVLDMLERDPFGEYEGVDNDTRRAYEYRQCILESGGLNACRSQYIEKYGERKVREFENLLKVREEWVHYQEKNPVFKYYTLLGNHADLKYLEEEDYQKLVAFFTGQEPAEGWVYKEWSNKSGTFVNKSPLHPKGGVSSGSYIVVRISDTLEADIFPSDLSMRIYKAPFAPANRYHFSDNHFCTGWLNSKNL